MDKDTHCDLLVIGAGMAGMAAGARAAVKGLDVVVAGSPSSLSFSSGIMDYLGVYPAGSKRFLDEPGQGLEGLVKEFPNHVYALVGREKIIENFEFIKGLLEDAGLPYSKKAGINMAVATTMGTIRPGFMVPETMAAGDLGARWKDMSLLVAGIKGLNGFSAAQVAQGLMYRFENTVSLEVELPGITIGVPPHILAGRMEDPKIRETLIRRILPHAPRADIIGLPAVCGIENSPGIMAGLADRINRPLFEIPGPPPSVPGLRLKNAFERILAGAGARLLSNIRIKSPVFDGRRFTLTADFDSRPLKIRAKGVILATGRFFGGGLDARRERIVEPVFHLDVAQPTGRHLWHNNRFFAPAGHAINRAGIETDALFRPLDERGRPVYSHLYAAGSILAHNDWARLKSGTGTAIVSACGAVDAFIETGGYSHGV